jgi:nesprin-1
MTLYKAVKLWVDEKKTFLSEPLELSSLTQARQKLHDYSVSIIKKSKEMCEK